MLNWFLELGTKIIKSIAFNFEGLFAFLGSLFTELFNGYVWIRQEISTAFLNGLQSYLPQILEGLNIAEIPVSQEKINYFYTVGNIWFPLDDAITCVTIYLSAWVFCWVFRHVVIQSFRSFASAIGRIVFSS